jgi:hypothetical protein
MAPQKHLPDLAHLHPFRLFTHAITSQIATGLLWHSGLVLFTTRSVLRMIFRLAASANATPIARGSGGVTTNGHTSSLVSVCRLRLTCRMALMASSIQPAGAWAATRVIASSRR